MPDLDWLTSRPIAHRGYHDASRGVVENSPSAIKAAVDHNFAIEVDLQETADQTAIVFHDNAFDRLTTASGPVRTHSLSRIKSIDMRGSNDPIWSLEDLLDEVAGKVGLCIEIKSQFRNDSEPFVKSICSAVQSYRGPVALKSFDPEILALLRHHAPNIPRGALADGIRNLNNWGRFSMMERFILRHMLHWPRTRPSFVSYGINDLPAVGPFLAQKIAGLPVVTWTVRTIKQREIAAKWADQMVFEGFNPDK
ncbi:MAG: glycerophosphodiester phosphodiesterase family protein [Stappiaceae bacterium]